MDAPEEILPQQSLSVTFVFADMFHPILFYWLPARKSERSAMCFWIVSIGVLFHFLSEKRTLCRYDWTYKYFVNGA